MKTIFLVAAFMAASSFGASKKIEAVKAQAAKEGIALTFEMNDIGFKYATGLRKPVGGRARVRKDKKFLKADVKLPAKFHISELLVNTQYKELCGVYDQGNCGSCVYNSIARNFCDSLRLRDVKVPDFLSRQELMSCTQGGRCSGEWAINVAGYLKQLGGLHDEEAYPYAASSSGTCKKVDGLRYGQIQEGHEIDGSAKSMFTALTQGYPLSVTVGADDAWMSYSKGVYNYCSGAGTNHEVLIEGWDCEASVDADGSCKFDAKGNLPPGVGFVYVQNSWGLWGEQGVMRSKLTSGRGGRCNNLAEEVVILETGLPLPQPPAPPPPVPPTPDPVPPVPAPNMPIWVWVVAGVLGLGVVAFLIKKR